MTTLRTTRGFTLIELMLAITGSIILIMGMGTVMLLLFQGIKQSSDFFEATTRVDLVRQLTFDARTGESLVYPSTDFVSATYNVQAEGSGSGYYNPEGGFHGHRVRFRAISYDPTTETSQRVFINWESRRPTASAWASPCNVVRIVDEADAFNNPVGAPVEWFDQSGIGLFHITRTSNRNFNVEMESVQADETAHVQLAVTLRNVR
ncbi:MAG: hypothetical protein KF696_02445 [Planctomycetes bacterium]|nr:hypothetical protein [Planctomycetota bacterium]MCW8134862.1 hypothetical protein [Planctomycetota bacterium]